MQPSHRLRYSLRALLATVAAIATLFVPLSYYLRYRMVQPDYFGGAVVYVDSYKVNPSFVYQRLIDRPELRNIKAIRVSSIPVEWLRRHVVLTQFDSHLIIDGYGRHEDIRRDELRHLIAGTMDIIRKDAEKSGVKFSILSNVTMQNR